MKENNFRFDHKDVVTALLKAKGIHEGIWMIDAKFGLVGSNVNLPNEDLDNFYPGAIIPLLDIGIARTDKLNSLAVDAAVVNPKPKSKPRAKKE